MFYVHKSPVDGNQQYEELHMTMGNEYSPFTIDASIGAYFMWSNKIDDETVQNLLNKNVVSLLIRYLRSIVS